MVLTRNPNYFDAPKPYLDQVTFKVVTAEDQRIDTFTTGAADAFYTNIQGSADNAVGKVKGSVYNKVDTPDSIILMGNNRKPPFDDLRVRQIVAYGVDRKAAVDIAAKGSTAADNFTVANTIWSTPDGALPKYDLTQAQKLVDAYVAEKNNGQPIKFTILAGQQSLDQARVKFVQTSLNQLKNVQVEIQVNDSPTGIGKVLRGEYQATSWGFPVLDPEPGLFNAAKSGLPSNYSKYSNPEVDKALDAARVTTDQTQRKALYNIVWEALARDLPYVPYIVTTNGFVLSPKLRGGTVYEDGILRFDLLWIKK